MKKILSISCLIMFVSVLSAQTSGGPDSYGYTWKNRYNTSSPPTYKWFDISTIGTQVSGLQDDNIVGPISIPYGFHYYWYDVTQFYVGSNGYISFKGENIASPFPSSIPLTSGANDWIAPLLADLNFTGTNNPAKCYYYSNSDTFCVSFIDVPFWENSSSGYTGSNTFQIILSRLDSSITFNYKSTSLGNKTSIDNIVGIENVTGSLGLSTYIDVLPPSLMTVKYYYPPVVTYYVTDAGIRWNSNPQNGGIFIKKQGDPLTLKANVKNLGNQIIGSFDVRDTIRNASGSIITLGTASVSSLNVGDDITVVMSNTFTPTVAGTYTYNTGLDGITNDLVSSNNYLQQEIIAVDTTLAMMTLDYSDGSSEGSLGWNGGNGGIAVYIEPPTYPVRIKSSRFYISSNATTPVGFYALIYDDDGPNGSHGTLLDSVYVAPSSVTTSTYNTVSTADTNLIITSGGVYVLWRMGGASINIGKDYTLPISRRTYEVLYQGWAEYRDILTEDFLMGINVEKLDPFAKFSYSSANDPTFHFTDESSRYPTTWHWNFGDNTTSTQRNPSHTYTVNGSYDVCLIVTNNYGADTTCKAINVANVPPTADFSADTSLDPVVSFLDLSSNNPNSWVWDFDDVNADSSSLQNPTYTFRKNGAHNVCLTAGNLGGTGSVCKTFYITNAKPFAEFTIDNSTDPIIKFNDISSNNPTSWIWDFGDNSSGSTAQNPSHNFSSNGTYNVCLYVSNAKGTDTMCKSVMVEKNIPDADFSFSSALDPKIVFADLSTNIPLSWYWDFNDNNATSTIKNPTYTFSQNGTYNVCLKATNLGGSDSICKNVIITKIAPKAIFSFVDSLDPTISFFDQSTSLPSSWLWDFDDGSTSSAQNPSHTYAENGTYNVCLKVTNGAGSHTSCQQITIKNIAPIADFSAYYPLDPKILFTDLSTKKPTSWHWDFDENGATSNLPSPSFTYTTSGNHNVCLTVTNTGGSDSICKNVFINNIPTVSDFSFDATNDPQVSFTDLSTNLPTAWLWTFDDNGATSTVQNPVYTFTKNGDHNVCLKASKTGSNSLKCKKVTILKVPPIAEFQVDSLSDPTFNFTDKSQNKPTSWSWDFDDNGATSNLEKPSHTFTQNGEYNVCLTVTNAGGSDQVCKTVRVKKLLPIADFDVDSTLDPKIGFTDKSLNIPTSWLWDFDEDGNTSTVQNPVYTFTTNGLHKVCLTATNANGNSKKCVSIVIDKVLPTAMYTYNPNTMPEVTFTDQSTSDAIAWSWDFDDNGNTSSDQNPVYRFLNDGSHNVCLIVTSAAGNSLPYCLDIQVSNSGIDEIQADKILKVYPNPFNQNATILLSEMVESNSIRINCYDVLGKKVDLNYSINTNIIELKRGTLMKGTYFLEIWDSKENIGKVKFIVY